MVQMNYFQALLIALQLPHQIFCILIRCGFIQAAKRITGTCSYADIAWCNAIGVMIPCNCFCQPPLLYLSSFKCFLKKLGHLKYFIFSLVSLSVETCFLLYPTILLQKEVPLPESGRIQKNCIRRKMKFGCSGLKCLCLYIVISNY